MSWCSESGTDDMVSGVRTTRIEKKKKYIKNLENLKKKHKSNGLREGARRQTNLKQRSNTWCIQSTHDLSRLRFINFYGYALRVKQPIDIIEFLCNWSDSTNESCVDAKVMVMLDAVMVCYLFEIVWMTKSTVW